MVRTVFSFSIGLFSFLLVGEMGFAQDVEPLINRLGLHTSSKSWPCPVSTVVKVGSSSLGNHSSRCHTSTTKRFNFTQKQERFSLQNIRNLSSLSYQGGRRLLQADHSIPLFSNTLSAGIEMVYRDPFLSIGSPFSQTTQFGTQILLKGSMKKMSYRAAYGFAGQDSGNHLSLAHNDRVGGNLLWKWQLPFVTPKIELSRFTNNVDQDPTRNQTVFTRQQYSLDWTIPNWPSFSLGYSRERIDTFSLSEESRLDASFMQKVTTKIAFEQPRWEGEWASRYSTSQNTIHDQGILEELHSTLKGTLNIYQPIKISPSLGFSQQTNSKRDVSQTRLFAKLATNLTVSNWQSIQPRLEWDRFSVGNQLSISDTLSSTLEYSCEPSAPGYHISVRGKYVLNQNSGQSNHPQMYDFTVFIKKDLQNLFDLSHQQQFVSLKFTHNKQVNSAPSQAPKSNSTAMLLVSIFP